MSPPKQLSDEEAADLALAMTPFECEVILQCQRRWTIGYARITEKVGARYIEVQTVGRRLQALKLAYISVVRNTSDEYAGSGLFLNERGEKVRQAIEMLTEIRARRLS